MTNKNSNRWFSLKQNLDKAPVFNNRHTFSVHFPERECPNFREFSRKYFRQFIRRIKIITGPAIRIAVPLVRLPLMLFIHLAYLPVLNVTSHMRPIRKSARPAFKSVHLAHGRVPNASFELNLSVDLNHVIWSLREKSSPDIPTFENTKFSKNIYFVSEQRDYDINKRRGSLTTSR